LQRFALGQRLREADIRRGVAGRRTGGAAFGKVAIKIWKKCGGKIVRRLSGFS